MPFYFLYLLSIPLLLNGCIDKDSFKNLKQKLKKQDYNLSKKDKVNVTTNKLVVKRIEENVTINKVKAIDSNITKLEKILSKDIVNNISYEENISKVDLINKEKEPIKINNNEQIILKTLNNDKIKIKFDGEKVIFEKYKNKIVIIEIFTTWCPSCLKSFTHLDKILKSYNKKVQVLGILLEKGRRDSEILKFKNEHKINYPITNCKSNYTLIKKWGGVSGYPTIIIFDKDGNYFNHYNGLPPYEMLKSDIEKVIRK